MLNNNIRTYTRRFTISYIWCERINSGPSAVCESQEGKKTEQANQLEISNPVRRSSQHFKAVVSDKYCAREDIGKFVRSQQRVKRLLVGSRRNSIKIHMHELQSRFTALNRSSYTFIGCSIR